MTKIDISIITPMKNEQVCLDRYFDQVIPILQSLTHQWEIICIDDGSSDGTLKTLLHFHQQHPQIKILQLARNFGKEYALSAGLAYCKGEAVIPLDADLQDPPQLIPQLIKKWHEGYNVVLAQRGKRQQDTISKRISAKLFYRLMKMIAYSTIHENSGDFRLLDQKVVKTINKMPERVRFMKGILAWPGFKTTAITYDRPQRIHGKTDWNFFKLWHLALDGIFSFSAVPLKLVSFIGASISLLSFLYALFLVVRTIIFGIKVPGYASLMTVILFASGVQLLSLGIVGEYVGRIYLETKQRPLYVVAYQWGFDNQPSP
jgi:glycosyltransferase involved in cell wall biosynthesis